MGGAERSRAGRWRQRLLASGGALLLAFLVLEGLARLKYGAPLAERLPILTIEANQHRGWRMVPGLVHYSYQHAVQVNALGLRGPEVLPRAPGEQRVLALGDSLIYGQGVADDETVPALLREALVREDVSGGEWTVVNGGHRAYDTRQELALLEEMGEVLDPDIVIIFWYWNDIKERDIDATFERLSESGPVAFDTGEPMEGWAKTKWRAQQMLRRSALLMTAHDLLKARDAKPVPEDYVSTALQRLDGYLERFQALAERDGLRVLFAIVPDANGFLGPHQSVEVSAQAEAIAASRGMELCELAPSLAALVEREGSLPVLPYDGHYNGAGNRALAEAVARHLLAKD